MLQFPFALVPLVVLAVEPNDDARPSEYAEVFVVDAETQRGIPLVELETVNALRFVTDNVDFKRTLVGCGSPPHGVWQSIHTRAGSEVVGEF